VDQARFQEAKQAYAAGDFRAAAKGFLASAGRESDGNGSAYHMAGNALMRLRRYQDAVTVYEHGLGDSLYGCKGAVLANLGAAHFGLGDYAEAARSYERALEEADYTTPYKAYQGMAGALLERGRVEDAAVAYRKAALDPENPDPGKALVNLGLCFMGLGRAGDAIEAYRAALGFDEYDGRGKALANLGQAYVAVCDWAAAVRSFEEATQMHNHKLSPAAVAAYATATARLNAPEEGQTVQGWDVIEPPAAGAPPEAVAIDATGPSEQVGHLFDAEEEFDAPLAVGGASPEAVAIDATGPSEQVGHLFDAEEEFDAPLAVGADTGGQPDAGEESEATTADFVPSLEADWTPALPSSVPAAAEAIPPDLAAPAVHADERSSTSQSEFGDEKAVADFFSATEDELKERDREARRAARHEKGPSAIVSRVAVVLLIVALIAGGLVGAYQWGYGWPTQAQTVAGALSAIQNGTPFDGYWVAAPSKDITKEMAKIPPIKSFAIDSVQQGATTSKAAVTITPKTGAALRYTITLSREGVGWKVSGVENDWSSTGG
jgi:tetratricopeptide (TPR) repeat protein